MKTLILSDLAQQTKGTMLPEERQQTVIKAACFTLQLLVDPARRQSARNQMPGFSDAAIFHRWMGLFWALNDPAAIELLNAEEKQWLEIFNGVYHSIPWVPVPTDPYVSDTSDQELKRLVPVATQFLRLLRQHNPTR